MEYSSTKKQRLPGISFTLLDDDDESSDNDSSMMMYNIPEEQVDITMNSASMNYHRYDYPVESPLIMTNEEHNDNKVDGCDDGDETMLSPVAAMASYISLTEKSASRPSTTAATVEEVGASSQFFSPTSNALNHSLIQHAENIVDQTMETPLEKVENGVLDVMGRLGAAFSSVKKRTLGEQQHHNHSIGSGVLEEEEEGGEQTVVLDVAAAYMARLARDGLYDDTEHEDIHSGDGITGSYHKEEQVNQKGCSSTDDDEKNEMIPNFPPLIAPAEKLQQQTLGGPIHPDESSHEHSKRSTYNNSCYHVDSNNSYDTEGEDEGLANQSYYIGNTEGFCSSESVAESSISETASEDEGGDSFERGVTREEEDNKSCSLDLAGVEQLMNLDDTLPSRVQLLERSNSDVDLDGMSQVMDLDQTLPLDDDCIDAVVEHDSVTRDDGLFDDKTDPLSNEVVLPLDENKEKVDAVAQPSFDDGTCQDDSLLHEIVHTVQDEASFSETEEDDDDFVPSALKEMISQQESHLSSLLGSISNMESTPGRIKRLEASLMGDEDEDAGLNEFVDMTNVEMGLTPVKRRLELVVEEESESESSRMKLTAAPSDLDLEPDLQVCEQQAEKIPTATSSYDKDPGELEEEATTSSPSLELEAEDEEKLSIQIDGVEENTISSTAPSNHQLDPETEEAATDSPPSLELDVDEEDIASPQESSVSVEVPCKSPWLSFLSQQSPLSSQPEEVVPSPHVVKKEVVTHDISEELPLSTSPSEDLPAAIPNETSKTSEIILPCESTVCVVDNNVAASVPQTSFNADDVIMSVSETSPAVEMNPPPGEATALESTDNLIQEQQLEESIKLDESTLPSSEVDDPSMHVADSNDSERLRDTCSLDELQITDTEESKESRQKSDVDQSNLSSSSEAFGSISKAAGTLNAETEPTLSSEEPTLECLRGAFLAAESKLEAESNVSNSEEAAVHEVNKEEISVVVEDDNSSDSVVNDTFETANFSLGDIEKAANEPSFFDAEDEMSGNDVDSIRTASESLDKDKSTEQSLASNDAIECDDEDDVANVLNEFTTNSAEKETSEISNRHPPLDSHDSKSSPGASEESILNESMFMPNASTEEVSPALVDEKLAPVVFDTHESSPRDESETEEGDDDEDFFPNRDLRRSTNVLKESASATTSTTAENTSAKHAAQNKISSQQLPNDTKEMKSGFHRPNRPTRVPRPALSSNKQSRTNKNEGRSQSTKDSLSQTRLPRARIRSRRRNIPIDGKENNKFETASVHESSGVPKKSGYSVSRIEQLAKPRRQSLAPSISPDKKHTIKKVVSLNRLNRLAQPRRQLDDSQTDSPLQKKVPQRVSIDRLNRLAQPKRPPVVPFSSPVQKKESQKITAGTPSFLHRSKLMSSSKPKSKSTEELEEEEMSQIKPFRAKPLNGREVASRFKSYESKPPRNKNEQPTQIPKIRLPTAIKPPSSRLYQPSPRRHKVMTFGEIQQHYLNNGLRSQPAPIAVSPTKLTSPKPFSLSADTRIKSKPPPASTDEIELQKKFKAKPYPFPIRRTVSCFQVKSSEELELEECRKQFKARPLPPSVSSTRISYDNTPFHIRAQQQHQLAMERKQMIQDESQETMIFKARPVPRSTYEARKIQRQSTSGIVRAVAPRPPRLSLASRAEQRKLFDDHARELREKDAELKEDMLRQQEEWEQEELRQRRMLSTSEGGLSFKAREINIEYM